MGDLAEFDFAASFDEDYLYFYEPILPHERSDAETDFLWKALQLRPGMEVLDLACGHGRIANRLAERGARVTGLDATPLFLARAQEDAAKRGLSVEYVEGDMRTLPWEKRFDCVVNWFTAFGYFDDDDNRTVLRGVWAALKPGGRFILDIGNRDAVLRGFAKDIVTERDGNYMIDRHEFDILNNRIINGRIIVRDGRVRQFTFFVRMFTFTELRDWFLQVGFRTVDVYGRDGEPFTLESRRMVLLGTK